MSYFFYDENINKTTMLKNQLTRKIKAHGGSLMLVEVDCQNKAVGAIHKHEHEQACYCLEGEFEFNINGEVKNVKAGDTMFIPSNVNHGFKLLSKTGKLLDIFTPQREDFLN